MSDPRFANEDEVIGATWSVIRWNVHPPLSDGLPDRHSWGATRPVAFDPLAAIVALRAENEILRSAVDVAMADVNMSVTARSVLEHALAVAGAEETAAAVSDE